MNWPQQPPPGGQPTDPPSPAPGTVPHRDQPPTNQAPAQPQPYGPPVPYGQPQSAQPNHGAPQYQQPHARPQQQPGQPPYGQPQYGQPQYGQPQPGQPQHGQPQPGQPQHAQPQPGQPQHAQPQYGQPQPGRPPHQAPPQVAAQSRPPGPPPGQPAWAQHQVYSPQYVAAQAQSNPTRRPMVRTILLASLVLVGSLIAALVFAVIFGFSYGVSASLLGLIFALIPLGIVLPVFIWLDRFESEPWHYLVTAFLYGALGSTLLALIVNSLGGAWLAGYTDPNSAMTLSAVLVAPLSEETFKGVFILGVWLLRRREFNGVIDGIVYGGIVGAGFAFTENILYLARTYTEAGGAGLAVTFVLRGLASPFLHPMFTAMTGIGIGIAATSRSGVVKVIAPILGWCVGVLAHGLWNLGASAGLGGFIAGFAIGFVAFVSFISFLIWARNREGRLIGDYLKPYAETGWLSPGEISMLASMRQRREARSWAKLTGGSGSLKAMRAFQDSASELALLRARMRHHQADDRALRTERVLLDSLTARRREFAGMSIR